MLPTFCILVLFSLRSHPLAPLCLEITNLLLLPGGEMKCKVVVRVVESWWQDNEGGGGEIGKEGWG